MGLLNCCHGSLDSSVLRFGESLLTYLTEDPRHLGENYDGGQAVGGWVLFTVSPGILQNLQRCGSDVSE